jgi:hypothetical protein
MGASDNVDYWVGIQPPTAFIGEIKKLFRCNSASPKFSGVKMAIGNSCIATPIHLNPKAKRRKDRLVCSRIADFLAIDVSNTPRMHKSIRSGHKLRSIFLAKHHNRMNDSQKKTHLTLGKLAVVWRD